MNRIEFGVLALIVVGMVFAPILIRASMGAPVTPGTQSYDDLRQADLITQGIVGYDPLRESSFAPSPSGALLAGMVVFGVPWLLPGLLSVLFLLLLATYLHRLTRHETLVFFALVIVAASPTLSVLGTTHGPELFALVALLGAVLLLDGTPILGGILVLLAVIAVPLLGIPAAGYLLATFARRKRTLQAIACGLAVVLGLGWFFLWSRGLPTLPGFSFANPLLEFGNPSGISVFLLIMALYGAIVPDVPRRSVLVSVAACLIALSMFVPVFLPVAVIVLAALAAYGIQDLVRVKWELETLRQSLIVLLCCLALFLVIVSVRARVQEMPTPDIATSLYYLHTTHRQGNVLSAPAYAPIIEHFAKRQATLHPEESHDVLLSRDAEMVYGYLERTGTSHVLVTEEMHQSLFPRSDEGILFLLPNTQRFVLVEQTPTTEVWYYIPR